MFQFNAESFEKQASAHAALARAFELAGNLDSSRAHTARALTLDSLDTRALELSRRLGLKSVVSPSVLSRPSPVARYRTSINVNG